eukprot:835706-Prorocentrum_lima.AAC.1
MTSSLVGSEMCIRDRSRTTAVRFGHRFRQWCIPSSEAMLVVPGRVRGKNCLLYTSDAADDM